MHIDQQLIINIVNIIFLISWGAYERISAIKKNKKADTVKDTDRNSLALFYTTIFLGYGVGIPVAFAHTGHIHAFSPYMSFIGFFIIISGLSIRLIAIKTLADQFTYTVKIINDHELIISGIYKYIRHPSYLGQCLIFFGAGLAFANWISFGFLFVPVLIATIYRIHIEEKSLIDHFSSRYVDYMRRSKRLIPFVY